MKADMLLKSNTIFAGISTETFPGMIAIKGNHIIYVGSKDKAEQYCDDNTKVIDYKNQMIIPGFHDAHVHFFTSALLKAGYIKEIKGQSEKECIEAIGDFAFKWKKDEWVITLGWYLPSWTDPVLPTKKSLDREYPEQPVAMIAADCHTLWVNSCGLKKLGLTKDNVHQNEEDYGRDDNGELTGVLYENAATAAMMSITDIQEEKLLKAYQVFQWYLAERGVTSVSDVSGTAVEGDDQIRDDIYETLLEQDQLIVRIQMCPTMVEDLRRPLYMKNKYQDSMLKFGGVKQFFDGVSSTHTAYLMEPYTNAYYEGDRGKTTLSFEKMEKLIMKAEENGINIRIHTIGDSAIHYALDFIEKAQKKYNRQDGIQHSLEHLENLLEDDIKRLSTLNVIASVQPAHILMDPEGTKKDLGSERIKLMWPLRSMLDSNVTVAFGTDSPISDPNPLHTLYYAVTRENLYGKPDGGWIPEQKITIAEALKAHTYGSACASNRVNEMGTLEKGKLADMVVLDHNIIEGKPEDLLRTKVIMTMTNGKIVYENHSEEREKSYEPETWEK